MSTTKIIITTIKYILLSIIFGIIANWIYIGYFWSDIWSWSKPFGIIISLIFIIIIPIIYLRNIKSMITGDLLHYVFFSYKAEFIQKASIYVADWGVKQYQKTKSNPKISQIKDFLSSKSWIVNRLRGYVTDNYLPIVTSIQNATADIDRSNPDSQQIAQTISIKLSEDPYISNPPNIVGGFLTILIANLIFMVLVYLFVNYGTDYLNVI